MDICGRVVRAAYLAGVIALSGCAGATAPEGAPLVIGPIESIDHSATASGILVRAAPGSRESCGIAARADADTRYYRRTGPDAFAAATLADLAIGDTVEVYVDGPVAESCPVQGHAAAFVLVGGEYLR